MNRRLPVYLLVDCSESMIGGGIESVRQGLSTMISKLRTDPHALDSVYLSVITFDSAARVTVPLTGLVDFQEPKLITKPGTAMGQALKLLSQQIEKEVQKTSHQTKGDYRPLVLLLTDGQPLDDWKAPLAKLGKDIRPRPANIYAIGCGEDVDFSILQSITDIVLRMENMGPESFAKLFVWLTASVSSASQGVGESVDGKINLEKIPDNIEEVKAKAAPLSDGPPRQVFLRARCATKKFPYLMRYRFDPIFGCYQPIKSHRLSEEEMQDSGEFAMPDIASNLLNGAPSCPWCETLGAGNCGNCGTIFCANASDQSDVTCPGCATILKSSPQRESSSFGIRQSGG
jgi:uncharacterized protein YegL